MLYLYLDQDENRLHCVSKTRIRNGHFLNHEHHVELVVPDDFVFQRSVVDQEGRNTVEDLTAQEILAAVNYAHQRAAAYPSIEAQLDTLYHGGYDAWRAQIEAVKTQYPKPESL